MKRQARRSSRLRRDRWKNNIFLEPQGSGSPLLCWHKNFVRLSHALSVQYYSIVDGSWNGRGLGGIRETCLFTSSYRSRKADRHNWRGERSVGRRRGLGRWRKGSALRGCIGSSGSTSISESEYLAARTRTPAGPPTGSLCSIGLPLAGKPLISLPPSVYASSPLPLAASAAVRQVKLPARSRGPSRWSRTPRSLGSLARGARRALKGPATSDTPGPERTPNELEESTMPKENPCRPHRTLFKSPESSNSTCTRPRGYLGENLHSADDALGRDEERFFYFYLDLKLGVKCNWSASHKFPQTTLKMLVILMHNIVEVFMHNPVNSI